MPAANDLGTRSPGSGTKWRPGRTRRVDRPAGKRRRADQRCSATATKGIFELPHAIEAGPAGRDGPGSNDHRAELVRLENVFETGASAAGSAPGRSTREPPLAGDDPPRRVELVGVEVARQAAEVAPSSERGAAAAASQGRRRCGRSAAAFRDAKLGDLRRREARASRLGTASRRLQSTITDDAPLRISQELRLESRPAAAVADAAEPAVAVDPQAEAVVDRLAVRELERARQLVDQPRSADDRLRRSCASQRARSPTVVCMPPSPFCSQLDVASR